MPLSKSIYCEIYPNLYRDSMILMTLSYRLGEIPGITQAMVVMGTENNLKLLDDMGLLTVEAPLVAPNDLVVAFRLLDKTKLEGATQCIQEVLFHEKKKLPGDFASGYHSINAAIEADPGTNLAVISLPGEFAEREAGRAIAAGLNVFIFSDNMPLDAEVRLKRLADEKGLLVMGPECGTSFINGVALGLASVARPGPVGVIGASGSGVQEVYSLLDRAGIGVSHAIGTGGRDLSAPVSGITTLRAISLLANDPATQVIALVSKKPDQVVTAKILDRVANCPKSVVVCFLGAEPVAQAGENVCMASTLDDAVNQIGRLLGKQVLRCNEAALLDDLGEITFGSEQKFIRGLFTGGTFCQEATLIWQQALGKVLSIHPFEPGGRLPDPDHSTGHTALDLGDEYFTLGRPHPCIDPIPRIDRMRRELDDREVAVIVLDIELGYGSHPDMAGELAPLVALARQKNIYVVAHICGTELDPQNVTRQEAKLANAGAIIAETNASAARLAVKILRKGNR